MGPHIHQSKQKEPIPNIVRYRYVLLKSNRYYLSNMMARDRRNAVFTTNPDNG